MRKVTIKDVAKEAGVAISTVSNALNDSHLVSKTTKAHILEVAERMNYIPNLSGRGLKAGKTKTVAFLSSSIRGVYFYDLLDSMSDGFSKYGYMMYFIVTRDKTAIMNCILGGAYDGVILFEGDRILEEELRIIEKNQIKTVLLDRKYSSKFVSSIVFNSFFAGYELTKYLIGLGHRNIVFIEGATDTYDSNERKRGFFAALDEYHIPHNDESVIMGWFEEQVTYNAVISYIRIEKKPVPDAFIAANDLSAIGCIKALNATGLQVPDDVSVVGFDDIELAQYFTPSLTTYKNPIDYQGRATAELMIKMIDGECNGIEKEIDGTLVLRKSAGISKWVNL